MDIMKGVTDLLKLIGCFLHTPLATDKQTLLAGSLSSLSLVRALFRVFFWVMGSARLQILVGTTLLSTSIPLTRMPSSCTTCSEVDGRSLRLSAVASEAHQREDSELRLSEASGASFVREVKEPRLSGLARPAVGWREESQFHLLGEPGPLNAV